MHYLRGVNKDLDYRGAAKICLVNCSCPGSG